MQGYRDGNVHHIPGNDKWSHVVGPSSAPVISVRNNLGKVGRDWTEMFFSCFTLALGLIPVDNGKPLRRGSTIIRYIRLTADKVAALQHWNIG